MKDHDAYIHPAIREAVDAPLPAEEFERRIREPLTAEELEDALALCGWFVRRYPTAKERLAFALRTFEQWTRPVIVRPRT